MEIGKFDRQIFLFSSIGQLTVAWAIFDDLLTSVCGCLLDNHEGSKVRKKIPVISTRMKLEFIESVSRKSDYLLSGPIDIEGLMGEAEKNLNSRNSIVHGCAYALSGSDRSDRIRFAKLDSDGRKRSEGHIASVREILSLAMRVSVNTDVLYAFSRWADRRPYEVPDSELERLSRFGLRQLVRA